MGEIGLQGTTTWIDGSDERVEAYDLDRRWRTGQADRDRGRSLMRRVPTGEIVDVLERPVGAWPISC